MYYLCFTKSYFSKSDQQNIQHHHNGFRIEGVFGLNAHEEKVVCILRETGKKELSLNEEVYEKFSKHIGKFPCVIISPDDAQIITDGSEERRRFMDALLCQLDAVYLQSLIEYNRIIQQRNTVLKSMAEGKISEKNLLDVYDEQLARRGKYIYEQRKSFLSEVLPLVKKYYTRIAGLEEPLDLSYNSQLTHSSFENLLQQFREKDLLWQRTNAGIHKDDIETRLNDQPFKQSASQGQRKSLLFALKLAEHETLMHAKGFAPILLLDDVFEKLDASRMHNLLHWVCIENKGQIFITDTHEERIKQHAETLGVSYQLVGL